MTVKVDSTPPAVTGGSADRPPDVGTWYVRPVTFTFAGSDGTSGIAGCSSVAYEGPDNGEAAVTGTCTDQAGNVSAPGSATLRYDATAPALRGVAARAGNGEVTVQWTQLPHWEWVDVVRSVTGEKTTRAVYHGSAAQIVDRGLRNGVDYRYTVVAHDEAGHATAVDVQAMPLGAMRSPPPGSTRHRAASAGLARDSRRAPLQRPALPRRREDPERVAAEPAAEAAAPLALRRAAPSLAPGTYRWYVWPAFRKAHGVRFGKLIGSSSFVVQLGRLAGQDPAEHGGVDVAAGHDARDLAAAGLAVSAAASASAPAPSAITRRRSASSRTASATSSSVTTAASSTTSSRYGHMPRRIAFAPAPSIQVGR